VRWAAIHVHSERLWIWRCRRRAWSVAQAAAREWGEDTPSEPESSGGDNKEEDEDEEKGGGNSPSPLSASHGPSLAWWPLLPASGDLCQGVPDEMSSDGDRANDQAITVVRPHTIIF
jgi:hypothetical protein